AVGMMIGLATFTVVMRHHRRASMLPAAAASGWIGALVALPFAAHLDVGAHQLVNLALFGITSFGLGLVLYTIGARYLHPARTAFASSLETEPAMITSSPCFQFTGVATRCFAVNCSESITRSTSSKFLPVVIG